jgi:hypothetical protein
MKTLGINMLARIPDRYWAYLALAAWGAVALLTLRRDTYGLDEGAARALLLIWSVADQVASGVVTFGAPDFRALLLAPVAMLWTGSIVAAKVFTLLLLAATARLFYLWRERTANAECALLSTGLLLLSPLTLQQLDSLGPGAFLLLIFLAGAFFDQAYRAAPRAFGGWYFAQLLTAAVSVSLHPAGLAYPLALLWSWNRNPVDRPQQRQFYAGISLVVVFSLVFGMGWSNLGWFQNPLGVLAEITLGSTFDNATTVRLLLGLLTLVALVGVMLHQFRQLWSDFMGRVLLTGSLLGLVSADGSWGMIALATLLYAGFPLLLGQSATTGGFFRQRGIAMLLLVILSTVFMLGDKAHYQSNRQGILAPQDQVIQLLAEKAGTFKKVAEADEDGKAVARFRVASQWPGRTMIACKCDTLPLPPAAKDAESQLKMLQSITYLMFDPLDGHHATLARNLALLGGDVAETVALQRGGVIIHFPKHERAESKPRPRPTH